jgi:hypothetical protein
MTARDTFNASVASAEKSKLNTIAAAETTRQATVDISNSFVGYNLQTGTFSSYQAAVTAANNAKIAALAAAEAAKQSAVAVARHTLQSTGDVNPI